MIASEVRSSDSNEARHLPPLENGDQLEASEFLRRYEGMPATKKAELVGGVVFMASPVRIRQHATPDSWIQTWLGVYALRTLGVESAINATALLNQDDVVQPDGLLRLLPECGGQTQIDERGCLIGAPELVAEIAASSAALDLHGKLAAYRRSGCREYLVWQPEERVVHWWSVEQNELTALPVESDGTIRSLVFPGLWLDQPALLRGDGSALLATLDRGMASPEYLRFREHLKAGL